MNSKDFDELCDRVRRGAASAQETERFVAYAIDLRLGVIDRMNESDTWDQDWPEVGYEAHCMDDGASYNELKAWEEKHRGR